MKRILGILMVLCMMVGVASAETLSASGTVTAGKTVGVLAPIGGTVEDVTVEAGMSVAAGETLVTLRTNKVYAPMSGTVTGVFVQPGDDAESVATTYGADLYLEGETKYTVSASTNKAYSSEDTTFVHVGEKVYLQCRSNNGRTGVGRITAVEGTSYTVTVTGGKFIVGDSVYIYRDSNYSNEKRIGQGNVERVSPTAVTTTGAVVSVAVQDGDTVQKGDLLMETLDGTWEGYVMGGTEIKAPEAGVVASVTAESGSALTQGSAAMTIYPLSGMRVEAVVEADDLQKVKVGDKVRLELTTDESKAYEGTVSRISALAEESTDETSTAVNYRVYISFTPDEAVSFGMSMDVTFGEDTVEEPAEEKAEESEELSAESEEKPAEETEEKTEGEGRTRPEMPADWNGEKPERPADGKTE